MRNRVSPALKAKGETLSATEKYKKTRFFVDKSSIGGLQPDL